MYDTFRKMIIEIPTISRNFDDKVLLAIGAQLMIGRAKRLGSGPIKYLADQLIG